MQVHKDTDNDRAPARVITLAPSDDSVSKRERQEPTRPEENRSEERQAVKVLKANNVQDPWGKQFSDTITGFARMGLNDEKNEADSCSPQRRKIRARSRNSEPQNSAVFSFQARPRNHEIPTNRYDCTGGPSPPWSQTPQFWRGYNTTYGNDRMFSSKPPQDEDNRGWTRSHAANSTPYQWPRNPTPQASQHQYPHQFPPAAFAVKDFPVFTGRNIEKFFNEFEFLAQVHAVPEAALYQLLSLVLTSDAASWFRTIGKETYPPTYDNLKNELFAAFQTSHHTREALRQFYMMEQEKNTPATTFILNSFEKMEVLQLRFTEDETVDHIIDRLLPPVKEFVRTQWPRSKRELFFAAKRYEDERHQGFRTPRVTTDQSNRHFDNYNRRNTQQYNRNYAYYPQYPANDNYQRTEQDGQNGRDEEVANQPETHDQYQYLNP